MTKETTKAMQEKLLPCPFCNCGSCEIQHDPNIFKGQLYKEHTNVDGWKYRCEGCGIQTCWWHTKEQMIEAWNKRTPDTTLKDLEETLASDEMVEKVAEASYDLVWTEIPWVEVGVNIKEAFRNQAKAAIATILSK